MGRLRNAKIHVERAVKQKKIFMIQGRYPVIRYLLRRRGWVEKKMIHPPGTTLMPSQKDLDSSMLGDSDTTEEDEEEHYQQAQLFDLNGLLEFDDLDGTHALMSRMVRNETPYLIWTTRRDVMDCRFLSKDQMINHYVRAGSFTTKVGLCLNLRNLPWFDEADADSFFPRCYCLGAEDDKKAFIGKENSQPHAWTTQAEGPRLNLWLTPGNSRPLLMPSSTPASSFPIPSPTIPSLNDTPSLASPDLQKT
uniref:Tubulin monoglycylase TTLL3 n=1 Tax=Marmota marmota marmota TaxID=9994 RepID=A0A8C6ERF9_MARMA